jgi:DNA primase
VAAHCGSDEVRSLVTELAVEPLPMEEPTQGYAQAYVARLSELTAARRIAAVKSRLQRTNPVEQTAGYNRLFGELVALEQHRRTLRERAISGGL